MRCIYFCKKIFKKKIHNGFFKKEKCNTPEYSLLFQKAIVYFKTERSERTSKESEHFWNSTGYHGKLTVKM